MKLAKRIGFKLIVVFCIISTFFSFIASTPVHASKVSTTDFYYSGTQKGSYTVGKSFIEKLVKALSDILDYILGLLIMVPRMVFVGWTALFERLLTSIVKGISGIEGDITDTNSTQMFAADDWITLDAIFFNRVPILNVNVFDFDFVDADPLGKELTPEEEAERAAEDEAKEEEFKEDNKVIVIFKELVAGWYYTLRLIAIMAMLVLLIYIGLKLAIKSVGSEKAFYKKVLVDWLVGMIMVFSIHYIMLFIINFNETLVSLISNLRLGAEYLEVYEYGLEERAEKISNEEMEYTLYDEIKTRAYDPKLTVGFSGMVMYMVLVYYAWKFTFIYLKRYLTVAVLVIMAPIVAVTYAYNKVKTGKSTSFTNWLKEFSFIVLLQSIHALIYVIFVQQALALSLKSIAGFILSLVMFNFMCKAEGLFRKIFNVSGSLTQDVAAGAGLRDAMNAVKGAATTMAVGKVAKAYTKGVARVATKPLRMAGNAGFGKYMEGRARKLNAQAKEEGYQDYQDKKSKLKKQKLVDQTIGKEVFDMENEWAVTLANINAVQAQLDKLKIGDKIQDEDGNTITVDEEYKNKKKQEIENRKKEFREEYKGVINLSKEEKDSYIKTYKDSKKLSTYLKGKWADIMDPDEYTEKVVDEKVITTTDEDGNVVQKTVRKPRKVLGVNSKGELEEQQLYKARKTERDCGKFGTKVEGISYRLSKNVNWQKIANLNKDEKKALKELGELSKNAILGFGGILVGIPMLVAEPAAGMAMMSIGITNSHKLLGEAGRTRERHLSNYRMDMAGKYTFKGFEGTSEQTMARGAKILAREQVKEIVNDRADTEASMKQRFIKNHPKMVARFNNARVGAEAVTVATVGMVGGAPAVATAIGTYGSVKLTGNVLNRMGDNAWTKFQAVVRASRKADEKQYKYDYKKVGTEEYLDSIADHYFRMNEQENAAKAIHQTQVVKAEYVAVTAAMAEQIELKTEAELDRDAGYEEEIKVEVLPSGKKKIALDAEKKLIQDALVESAQKCGIMDVADFNADKGMTQIEQTIEKKLIVQGIIERDGKVSDIIENLDGKVKDTQAKLKSSGMSRQVVEEKMAGDAVISVMQDKSITDPTQVSEEDVFDKYSQMYKNTTVEASQSRQKTDNVLQQLQGQKPEVTPAEAFQSRQKTDNVLQQLQGQKAEITSPEETPGGINKESILVMIRDRQKTFAGAAAKPSATSLEEKKRRAKAAAVEQLNRSMLAASQAVHADEAEPAEPVPEQNVQINSVPEQGTTVAGVSADDIIKMINLTTEMEKSKKRRDYAYAKATKEQKRSLYLEIKEEDMSGTRRVTSDGSRRVFEKVRNLEEKKQAEEFANMDTKEFLGAIQKIQRN